MSSSMFRSAFRSTVNPLLRSSVQTQSFRTPTLSFAARFLSQEARSKIQSAVKSTPVVLFMKGTPDAPRCGYSRGAVQILGLHSVSPEKLKTYDVMEDSELRSGIKEFSDWPTIPQLYVDGEFVGGFDILCSMHSSGELEELLEKKGVLPPLEEEAQTAASSGLS
ncbi:glutaredoxin [Laetiporus sulphureus 93-53]|uniref:Monothiol glutaredoxin-5, mitochondrial n=1 Tax=Laetiporus sulphureus 93-53 TaxID=1314785 RepID=A0A165G4H9_9APHY|nr:glutaredoxin [Laetiporus sulphureus 93-53]KZT09818.1 glutaredoxin [Laetiporus sulphureus 93-53]